MTDQCKLFEPDKEQIGLCKDLLEADQLIAVPTETVYGLAGNALSEVAVRKIFSVKGRPLVDPLITHYQDAEAAFEHVVFNKAADRIAQAFWPGPITLVLPKRRSLSDLITAGLPTAAVRVPQHPVFKQLLSILDFPLAAPSANPFGYVSPTRPSHVAATLGSRISGILNGGPSNIGIESTILDLRDPQNVAILRPGPVSREAIEEALQQSVSIRKAPANDSDPQSSPGQLSRHYSPRTSLTIIPNGSGEAYAIHNHQPGQAVILNQKPRDNSDLSGDLYWLSESEDMLEMSQHFFDLLQRLDKHNYTQLAVESLPEQGIGIALNDRLRRAAAKS